MNNFSPPPVQPLRRIEHGNTISYSTKLPFTMSINGDGRCIRFSHCPGLTFPSLQSAFDYFNVQAKLHDQRVIQQQRAIQQQRLQVLQAAQDSIQMAQRKLQAEQQSYPAEDLSLRAGQLADLAAQQACSAKALYSLDPVWQFDPPLKPVGVQPIVNLPMLPSHSELDSQCQPVNKPLIDYEWEEPDPVHSSSISSPLEAPPQTLFAESTPHAQELQEQPRVRFPATEPQSWPFQSQLANKNHPFLRSIPPQFAEQAVSLPTSSNQSSTCVDAVLPQNLTNEVDISNQPPDPHGLYSLLPYTDTVLPETLNKKDRRVLGVSLSASNDE